MFLAWLWRRAVLRCSVVLCKHKLYMIQGNACCSTNWSLTATHQKINERVVSSYFQSRSRSRAQTKLRVQGDTCVIVRRQLDFESFESLQVTCFLLLLYSCSKSFWILSGVASFLELSCSPKRIVEKKVRHEKRVVHGRSKVWTDTVSVENIRLYTCTSK